jgi:hypothetical protein
MLLKDLWQSMHFGADWPNNWTKGTSDLMLEGKPSGSVVIRSLFPFE